MEAESKYLSDWTPRQIELAKKWPGTSALLEQIRNEEIRTLSTFEQISLLCDSADYNQAPYAPKPYSGLVEQQRLFMKALQAKN
jgi:hypothetical protein